MTIAAYEYLSDQQIPQSSLAIDCPAISSGATILSDSISIPRDMDAGAGQLKKLLSLGPNWDGEGSPAPNPKIIKSAILFLSRLASLNAVIPCVHPTRVGGVLFSWEVADHDLEVDFVTPHVATFVHFDHVSGASEEGILCRDGRPPANDDKRFCELIEKHFRRNR